MIGPVLRKDLSLLWPLAAAMTVIQMALEWALYKSAFFGVNPVAAEIVQMLTLPWFLGVVVLSVVAVHEDPVPGADQDWLVRPIRRLHLLSAKLLFVVLTVALPMLLLDTAHELALGFAPGASIFDALFKEFYLLVCLVVPAMALASMTRNLTELVGLLGALVVLYALSLATSGFLFGTGRCPTCETGVSWLQHLWQHLLVFAGAVAILGLQYLRRATSTSGAVAAAGIMALVFAQIPWQLAFAVQSALDGDTTGSPVILNLGTPTADSSGKLIVRGPSIARQTTQALLHGNVDSAVDNLKRFSRPEDAPVTLSLPVAITGIGADEFLVADRVVVTVVDEGGNVLYRGMNAAHASMPMRPDPASGSIVQPVEIPAAVYAQVVGRSLRLKVDYSLTRMRVVDRVRMRAIDGEARSAAVGLCQSRSGDTDIRVVCRRIGLAPSCYALTLFGPDGTRNPDSLVCRLDYRPFLPSPVSAVSLNALGAPLRDPAGLVHYPVDTAKLADAYIELKAFRPAAHFRRTAMIALARN